MDNHLTSPFYQVDKQLRQQQAGHRSFAVWLTGLSGAGKSTLANLVEQRLHKQGLRTYVLDGDQVRNGLSKDLGFAEQERHENLRRVAEVARLMVDAGIIVIAAFITPFRADRKVIKSILSDEDMLEVYVKCPLSVCENRDVKGLYAKARNGIIKNFTGIDSPYEEPENPGLVINTDKHNVQECAALIFETVQSLL